MPYMRQFIRSACLSILLIPKELQKWRPCRIICLCSFVLCPRNSANEKFCAVSYTISSVPCMGTATWAATSQCIEPV